MPVKKKSSPTVSVMSGENYTVVTDAFDDEGRVVIDIDVPGRDEPYRVDIRSGDDIETEEQMQELCQNTANEVRRNLAGA